MSPVASLWRGFRCAVPVVVCPAIRAEALPFGDRQVTDAIATLRAGAGGGLPAGGNLNRWSVHPGPGRQEGPRQAPTGVCDGAGRFAALGHPHAVQVLDAHRLVFTDGSRGELVERVQVCRPGCALSGNQGRGTAVWRAAGYRCGAVTTLRAGAGGGDRTVTATVESAHTPSRCGRWAVSGRQPEPLVRPSRSWTPGGSSAGANRRLQWGGPVCGSWPSPCGSGARCTPSGVHGWVPWRACGEGSGVAVPVVLCPAIRAEALPFGERQVTDAVRSPHSEQVREAGCQREAT